MYTHNLTSVEILQDSINLYGDRLITLKLIYPRFIHSELKTHRIFSTNSSSSRAIPIEKQIDFIEEHTCYPVHWGKNRSGMSADLTTQVDNPELCKYIWNECKNNTIKSVKELLNLNLHKQVANRLLEPFTYMYTILSGTEFNNFFNLRLHKDAQPEIQYLAKLVHESISESTPKQLEYGEWHLPFSNIINSELSQQDRIKISISCCAQISYRNFDTSLEKADKIFSKLIESKPVHASVLEHVATPFSPKEYETRYKCKQLYISELEQEIEKFQEMDLEQFFYKRNFKGWTQFRLGVDGETNLFERY